MARRPAGGPESVSLRRLRDRQDPGEVPLEACPPQRRSALAASRGVCDHELQAAVGSAGAGGRRPAHGRCHRPQTAPDRRHADPVERLDAPRGRPRSRVLHERGQVRGDLRPRQYVRVRRAEAAAGRSRRAMSDRSGHGQERELGAGDRRRLARPHGQVLSPPRPRSRAIRRFRRP